jgi:hypothetical protein
MHLLMGMFINAKVEAQIADFASTENYFLVERQSLKMLFPAGSKNAVRNKKNRQKF